MNPQLEYLCQLQGIDIHIRALDKEISRLPGVIEDLKQGLKKEEEAWEEKKREEEQLEKRRRDKERKLTTAETMLDKYNSQLLSIKTNKEYTAILHEIDMTKNEISALEEEILHLLDEVEGIQSVLNKQKVRFEKSKQVFEDEKKKIQERLDRLNRDKDASLLKRKGIEDKIDQNFKKEYKKLYEARKGLAVTRAKYGSCVGCNMELMPQLFQEIMMNLEDKIYYCPNCNRILFYKPENEA